MKANVNIFKIWMRAATTAEQTLMAEALGTSRSMLYQISGGFKPVNAERGAAIEALTAQMHTASLGRLPLVYRTDLVDVCRGCAFAQQCLGGAAERAAFDVVTIDSIKAVGSVTHD